MGRGGGGDGQSARRTRPRRTATFTASVRLVTPSFSNRWPRWVLTVRSLMPSALAISLFALPVGHQPQRGQLARRQLHAGHALGELGGGRRREIGLAGEHVVDAGDEGVGGDVFQHVRLGSGFERAGDVLVGVVGRQHDDLRLRIARADLPHGFDAFHHRHAQIEQRDVGPVALEGLDRFDAVRGFGHHFAGRARG